MTDDLNFPLASVYDKVTLDTGLFDYANLARAIVDEVGPDASVLELCVGTGLLALAVRGRGPRVAGLDLSGEMLERATDRFLAAGQEPDFIHASAIDFRLHRSFDAVYVYSGHILLNRRHAALFVNGVTVQELRTALHSAYEHIVPGGRILLGIEQWETEGTSRLFPTNDGSWYQRSIIEENDLFGTRMHVFFSKPESKLYIETSERSPKLSEQRLIATLGDIGFTNIGYSAPSQHDPDFLIARRG